MHSVGSCDSGQLGVVSGTAIDTILARRLQLGDPGGHMRRALEHLPVPEATQRVLDKYFIPNGKSETAAFVPAPVFTVEPSRDLLELTVAANFAEVFVAKEGHDGLVGINFLEKIQLLTLPSLYGALLANIDLPQVRPRGYVEQPLVTVGDDIPRVRRLLQGPGSSYSATDVIDYLSWKPWTIPADRAPASGVPGQCAQPDAALWWISG